MDFDEVWGRLRGEATERVTAVGNGRPLQEAQPADTFDDDAVQAAKDEVLERLAHFRSSAVLVPLDDAGGLWTVDFGGISWICAFADEPALARFTQARGDETREWPYRRVLGSRLLDEVVPAVPFPCGVALNAGSPGGAVFPPVKELVPHTAAVDIDTYGGSTE
ncbi:hypothetical protein ACIQ7Q_29770 [Streptomyces sp. NPDC096176]|uniref:hypothetical protein n=1 Tax=Streptomyces sp. NPDC096176 TaxID=3366079 RepID=UPI00382B0A19